ncbi:hypothetical protein [Macrococcus animalis]|uniref:hypothetical protein n=1 Tax=Macrococcus animalis TaxID=3395467 RepID=UPI0039BE7AD8
MDKITINTFASTIGINSYEHSDVYHLIHSKYPNIDKVPIGELERIESDDNEGYFEGSIELKFNDEVIISRKILTGDLYLLWHDLYLSTIQQTYEISYLDISYTIKTVINADQIIFEIHDTELNEEGKKLTENDFVEDINQYIEKIVHTYSFSLEVYKSAVIEGLITFFKYLNHDFKRNKFDSPYYFGLEKVYNIL